MVEDNLRGRTILVADDDPDILGIVSSIIEMTGAVVLKAANGTQAKSFIMSSLPDLAILDLTMPGHTGSELCTILRGLPGGDLVPVMILTARDSLEDKVSAFEGGADDYVTKPFNHHELLARARALLRIRKLNLALSEKNRELHETQQKLLEKERAIAINQIGGTAAHQLGQPLSAIMLNIHLVEQLPPDDERHQKAVAAIKQDSKRMAELLEKIRGADPTKTSQYHGKTKILDIEGKG